MSTEPNTRPEHGEPGNGWEAARRWAVITALAGFAAYVVLGVAGVSALGYSARQFALSYLVAFIFWISMPLGSMAMLFIHYLTGGRWGVLLRRVFEANTRTLPLMAVLFVPVVAFLFIEGVSPYWWTTEPLAQLASNEEALEELTHKRDDFLNPAMFIGLSAVWFLVWGVLIYLQNRWSAAAGQDVYSRPRELLHNIAGPGLILYALTNIFASTHWVMSLEMSWASTMFPVIYSVNQLLVAYLLAVLVLLLLAREGGPLAGKVKPVPHQIDLGSFMLALTLFWTYISFAQFLLVWVGNLPEEIPFYLKRIRGGWQVVGIALAIFHFFAPMMLLLMRDIKRNSRALRGVAVGLLVLCAFDVFWWIAPAHSHEGQPLYWLMDVAALAGVGGAWLWWFLGQLDRGRELLPEQELHVVEEAIHGHK